MSNQPQMQHQRGLGWVRPSTRKLLGVSFSVFLALGGTRAIAQEANFETRSLSPGFSPETGSVSGYTGGSYSLSALSNRDREGNACLGYGDSRPDHILVLEAPFQTLTLQVDSGGKDTTLMVQGPDGFLCGDDTDSVNLDAQLVAKDWKPSRYKVWVGTMEPGNRGAYRLTISE